MHFLSWISFYSHIGGCTGLISDHCIAGHDCGWIPVVIALVKLKLLLSGTLNENGEPGDKNVQVSKALTIGLQLVSHKKCKVLKTRCLWSLQYIEQYGQVSAKVHGASMCSLCFGVFQCCSCLLVGQFRASEGRWRVKVGAWSSLVIDQSQPKMHWTIRYKALWKYICI